ncbi:prolyl aminopeptidase [Novosphingobium sp. Gsoil 351]|uniref:prolyl aminopeptidase n=1 Tax=Novosphingobium sp. Gsoil 351 TaxID=2675225 RepID=UPI0012B4BBAD|nr:prolyl aminopeptidase [Novosphingobium sp. Gsoil 351]QGN55652.1 prolyl aminopeptidase [Novosphingobium sp. Gsoil 351]
MTNPDRTKASPPSHLDFLYPPLAPLASGMLDVGDDHQIYWEQSGKADGVPVLFLHGGPGAPSRAHHRQWFDPDFYRFVTFHQRGCGQSTPLAATHANTTQHLIADIEELRAHLGIEQWLVFGGSWGTALGLAYGEAHPATCLGFILSGVTLVDVEDRAFWWRGARQLFPEAFDRLLETLPHSRRHDPMNALHQLILDLDPAVHMPAALALCLYSAATVGLQPSEETLKLYGDPNVALPLARLFLHYSANVHFLEPGQLLKDIDRIADKPCTILGGRYDVTTPVARGWALHKAWPGSTFQVNERGAHALSDASTARTVLDAIENAKQWCS